MRLALSIDPAWRTAETADGRCVAIGPDLVITYDPPRVAPRSLAIDVPPDAHVEMKSTIDGSTRTGWPMRLVDAELVGGAVETRLYAFYQFFAYTAVALARGTRNAIDANRDTLRALFESADIDLASAPVCLADTMRFHPSRFIEERVLEKLVHDGFEVEVIETVRFRNPAHSPILTFRADGVIAIVETSDHARKAGTPYVLGLIAPTYRAIRTYEVLPPYTDLKAEILPLLVEAIRG